MTLAAHNAHLDAAISDAWRDYSQGLISDDEVAQRVALLAGQRTRQPRPIGRQLRAALTLTRFAPRRYQRSPDREASRRRRRMLGSDGRMPQGVRAHYTEGQRAALTIIANEIKRHGRCDFPIDKIAALAGVSRTTAQNAIREAIRLGHLSKEERPVQGRKNLTNVLRITSREWLTWLEKGPRIGFKSFLGLRNLRPTKTYSADADEEAAEERKIGNAVEATKIAERLGDIAGIKPKHPWPPGWCGVELHVRNWLAQGWAPDVIMAASRATMARKPKPGPPCSPSYFAPEIARLHSDLARPIVVAPRKARRQK
jgi:hypothetical protein